MILRIVFWAKLEMAKQEIIDACSSMLGVELQVTTTLEETLTALPGASALVLVHGPQEEAKQIFALLRRSDNTVKWMHFISAGREGYEELGYPEGITVSWAGGGVAPAVAEHAMALLLASTRQIPALVTKVMPERTWDRSLVAPMARSLEGANLVIVGYGHIGKEVARRARAFDTRIITVSRSAIMDDIIDQAWPLTRLKEALGQADAVILTIALTPETTKLIGEDELNACKTGIVLVNVARGLIVDQVALAHALKCGRVGYAALDVTNPEPLPANDPLWDSPHLLISPHYGGSGSPKSVQRLANSVENNLRRFIEGKPLLHVVAGN